MVGQVLLGKYKILRLLDEGGMSRIFLAQQTNPDREVVVKVIKPELIGQPRTREHFRREIHILSRFQHPHAVAYFDAAPNDRNGPVLIMEYLRGLDLHLLLHRQGKLGPERVGRLLAQLCNVLQAAHDAGIVHRDVKPGNVILLHPGTPQEHLKLMDFGLAKMSSLLYISPDDLVDFSLPAAAGTPEYIAPEQVRGTDMDGRGDLYSVGVVLFELLTGRRPFQGATVQDLMRAHADQAPPTFAEMGLTNQVPAPIENLVRACLAKHPDRRPQTARELLLRYEVALGRKISLQRNTKVVAAAPAAGPIPSAPATPPPRTTADLHAVQHTVEARMPEAMAIFKLKGFIHDLGGEVVESVPGLIRVRLAEPAAEPKPQSGLFGWKDRSRLALIPTAAATEIELHMARPDPARADRLTITLVLRPRNGVVTPEWRGRCKQIGRDLNSYLMG